MLDLKDSTGIEAKWLQNEAELNRIYAAPGLDREMLAARIDELEREQDAIELELGRETSVRPDSRRWSGMP